MEKNFTQGRWSDKLSYNHLGEPSTHAIVCVEDNKGLVAAHIYNAKSTEETIANAKLIAAAPELLEVLELIIDSQYNPKKTLANMNSEISKARDLLSKINL